MLTGGLATGGGLQERQSLYRLLKERPREERQLLGGPQEERPHRRRGHWSKEDFHDKKEERIKMRRHKEMETPLKRKRSMEEIPSPNHQTKQPT